MNTLTSFTPTSVTLHPPGAQDLLGQAVERALRRELNPLLSWPIPKALALGLPTAGLAPALLLPRLVRDVTQAERQQLFYLCRWLRQRTGDDAFTALAERADRVGAFRWLRTAVLALALSAVSLAAYQIVSGPLTLARTWIVLSGGGVPAWLGWFGATPPLATLGYSALLTAACTLMLAQVNAHVAGLRAWVRRFNASADAAGFRPVPLPAYQPGLRPGWLAVGIALALLGPLWALPMMLAACAQRRYITRSSLYLRRSLARRVRTWMAQTPPSILAGERE